MIRVIECQDFLMSLAKSKAAIQRKLIAHCTDEELKAIIECVINTRSKIISKQNQKTFQPVYKYFATKSALYKDRVKQHLLANHKLLGTLICTVLTELINIDLACNIYN
jgi:Glu-tRNA(Gln) amidotransferase subunit E-like FAD-binding protein